MSRLKPTQIEPLTAADATPADGIYSFVVVGGKVVGMALPGGLPAGGTAEQRLAKVNSTDFNAYWKTVTDILLLNPGDPVPGGTTVGTIIVRKA